MLAVVVGNNPAEHSKWPILSLNEVSRKQTTAAFFAIGVACIVSIIMTFVYPEVYLYGSAFTTTELLLGCSIYIAGFLGVVLSTTMYLGVYNWIGILIAFTLTLGLVLIVVLPCVKEALSLNEKDPYALFAFISFVSAGLIEEAIKMVAYLTPILIFKRYRSVYDVVYLATVAGCSFSVLENVMVYNIGTSGALTRFLLLPVVHSVDAVIGALILSHIKTGDMKAFTRWLMYPLILLVPAAFHGIYDYVCFVGMIKAPVFYLFIVVTVLSIVTALFLFRPFRRAVLAQPAKVVHILEAV